MKGSAAVSAAALALAGCLAAPDEQGRRARRGPCLAVTIYSAPPRAEDDRRHEEEERKRASRGVAKQMKIFADYFAGDPSARPYGFGVVKDEREISLPAGRSEYRFSGVARYIEPETVHIKCLGPSGVEFLEQDFEYDLVSARAVLGKYVDRRVGVLFKEGGRASGRLLSADEGHIVLETSPGETELIARSGVDKVLFPELPEGLVTRPTLAWLVDSKEGGNHRLRVAYRARGFLWEAGYTALLSPDEKTLDLSGVATIGNASGASFENARLKLVAGELNLVDPMEPLEEPRISVCFSAEEPEDAFEEKTFFEYHLYALQRPCTIRDNEVKQIELFRPVSGVPVRKTYVYHGAILPGGMRIRRPYDDFDVRCSDKVDVYLHFRNEEEAGLGMPLPAGPVRILKRDPADGEMELVGDDVIDHTPRDEEVTLRLGRAFDITGERRQISFSRAQEPWEPGWMEETIEIVLRNHKDEDVEVTVKETMYRWLNWEIVECSCEYGPKPAKKRAERPPAWHAALLKTSRWKKVEFRFRDKPLVEAVEYLKALTGAKIVLDPGLGRIIRKAGITLTAENAELPVALEAVVAQADLECCVRSGSILITDAAGLVETKEYDASGLAQDTCSLAEMIVCIIEPDTWAPELGASIEARGRKIVVSQTPDVHRKIRSFLDDLSRKLDSRTVLFVANVPANGEEKIRYTVRYTW